MEWQQNILKICTLFNHSYFIYFFTIVLTIVRVIIWSTDSVQQQNATLQDNPQTEKTLFSCPAVFFFL